MTALATSVTEKLIESKPRWSGQIGSGGVADGTVTTIPLQSATNLDNGDIYIATINRVNAQSVKQDTWETFIGELSGTNFINCVRRVEGTATASTSWAAGTVVEILFTAKHWNNMIDFLGVEHNSDGTHGALTADSAAISGAITATSVNIGSTIAVTGVLDEDTMSSNSAVKLATQQSIKAYVDGINTTLTNSINKRALNLYVVDATTDTSTGDGKMYFTIPSYLNTWILKRVHGRVITAGTTGTTDIQLHSVTDAVDMLSTKLTIDSGETGSDTAATAAVIDTANDDVATNDLIRVDIDAVSTTAAKGLILTLEFEDN